MSVLQAKDVVFKDDQVLHHSEVSCMIRVDGSAASPLVSSMSDAIYHLMNVLPHRSHEGVHWTGSKDAAPPLRVKGHQ